MKKLLFVALLCLAVPARADCPWQYPCPYDGQQGQNTYYCKYDGQKRCEYKHQGRSSVHRYWVVCSDD